MLRSIMKRILIKLLKRLQQYLQKYAELQILQVGCSHSIIVVDHCNNVATHYKVELNNANKVYAVCYV
jgi:hypothetical protein